MNKSYGKIMILFLFLILFGLNYTWVNNLLVEELSSGEIVYIERVIDGDTVVVNGTSVRMLGINTPEKGEYFYGEAKIFLENFVMNKSLKLEKYGKDKYNRDLGYLFLGNKNINIEVVRNGYANFYFPSGKDKYYEEFVLAWDECLNSGKNLCEKSADECAECIILKEWNFNDDKIVFYNRCDFDCNLENWEIKDEGRKKYIFDNFILNKYSDVEVTNEDFNESYVWTSTGDSFILRDSDKKLVLFGSNEY